MSDHPFKKHGPAISAYFSEAVRYFHPFVEPTTVSQRVLPTGQLFLLPLSLCASRLGRDFLPLLLQIVQQFLGGLLPVPLWIVFRPTP